MFVFCLLPKLSTSRQNWQIQSKSTTWHSPLKATVQPHQHQQIQAHSSHFTREAQDHPKTFSVRQNPISQHPQIPASTYPIRSREHPRHIAPRSPHPEHHRQQDEHACQDPFSPSVHNTAQNGLKINVTPFNTGHAKNHVSLLVKPLPFFASVSYGLRKSLISSSHLFWVFLLLCIF